MHKNMYFEYEIPFETCIYLQKREVGKLSLENKEDGKIKIRFYIKSLKKYQSKKNSNKTNFLKVELIRVMVRVRVKTL